MIGIVPPNVLCTSFGAFQFSWFYSGRFVTIILFLSIHRDILNSDVMCKCVFIVAVVVVVAYFRCLCFFAVVNPVQITGSRVLCSISRICVRFASKISTFLDGSYLLPLLGCGMQCVQAITKKNNPVNTHSHI